MQHAQTMMEALHVLVMRASTETGQLVQVNPQVMIWNEHVFNGTAGVVFVFDDICLYIVTEWKTADRFADFNCKFVFIASRKHQLSSEIPGKQNVVFSQHQHVTLISKSVLHWPRQEENISQHQAYSHTEHENNFQEKFNNQIEVNCKKLL